MKPIEYLSLYLPYRIKVQLAPAFWKRSPTPIVDLTGITIADDRDQIECIWKDDLHFDDLTLSTSTEKDHMISFDKTIES